MIDTDYKIKFMTKIKDMKIEILKELMEELDNELYIILKQRREIKLELIRRESPREKLEWLVTSERLYKGYKDEI